MTEEEVKKQEKRIAKFNQLNGELLPYKKIANHLTPESISNGVYIGIGHTYGGDMCLSLTKKGSSIGSVNIEYNEELANQLMEIVKPIILNKVKMLEEQIDKV